jgi:hypothetical protein
VVNCDICGHLGDHKVVLAKSIAQAVQKGFNPYSAGLIPDMLQSLGLGTAYDAWRVSATEGHLSKADWHICENCMLTLHPFL